MAVDRSIRVTIYTSINDEDQATLVRRLMTAGAPVGTTVTTMGSYVAGTRVNNMLIAVGTGSVELSARFDVDAAVSVANFLILLGRVIRACVACSSSALTMTSGTYSVGSSSTDSVLMTIT